MTLRDDQHDEQASRPEGLLPWSVGRTLGAAAESLSRALTSLSLGPQLKGKNKPGSAPGIETHELASLASAQPPSTAGPVHLTCIDYSPDRVQVQDIDDIEDFIIHHRPQWATVRWINVDGLSDLNLIRGLAEKYRLHPLAIEDVLHVTQRPKVDPYPDEGDFQARMFLLIRMIQLREGRLHSEQISMFLGHSTLITFQETRGDVWDPIRHRLNVKGSRLRTNDASFLVYSLVDAAVDHCFPILEYYGDKLHELEEEVLDNPSLEAVQRMHELNRELMLLRRQVWPMRDVIQSMQRETHECMSDVTRTYLRDVYDHIVQVIDMIETYREIAASIAETYATLTGNKLNEAVKVLAVLTAIFTPPTFLASVYGMNFKLLPELQWQYGYLLFWGVSILSSVGLMWWIKRKGWL